MHQGLSFLSKNQCDVRSVEFARCYRLTNNSIEPISFTVPRLKVCGSYKLLNCNEKFHILFQTELFQDDLFRPTRVTWTATISAQEWFEGKNKKPARISLQPEGMDALSSVIMPPPSANSLPKTDSVDIHYSNSQMSPEYAKSKQEALKKSVSERVQVNYGSMEQDGMEGVEEKEWDEEE